MIDSLVSVYVVVFFVMLVGSLDSFKYMLNILDFTFLLTVMIISRRNEIRSVLIVMHRLFSQSMSTLANNHFDQ